MKQNYCRTYTESQQYDQQISNPEHFKLIGFHWLFCDVLSSVSDAELNVHGGSAAYILFVGHNLTNKWISYNTHTAYTYITNVYPIENDRTISLKRVCTTMFGDQMFGVDERIRVRIHSIATYAVFVVVRNISERQHKLK